MGILDDAIREHLELKRRRGADPTEIERAEQEALGPARRPAEPVDAASYGDEAPYDDGHYDDEHAAELEEELGYAYGSADEDAPLPHVAPPAESPVEDLAAERGDAVDAVRVPPPDARPPHDASPRAPEDDLGQETVEYRLEPPEPAPGQHPDDVLEETPEFLQDTPDHDRLWFEQRPPRDFKFDS
jgi:hypothetical protein